MSDYEIYFLTISLIFCIILILNRKTNKNTHTTGNTNMTDTKKAANYTDDQVVNMIATYSLATTPEARKTAVAELAQDLGKNVKSVIAKLSREGVYVKAAKATKSGAKVETKAEIVAQIAEKMGVEASAIESLGNATKAALVALREAS